MIGDTKSTSTMHHVPRECATPLFLDEFIDSEYGQQKCWVVTTSWRRHDLAYGYTVSNELEVAGPQVVLHNSMEPLGIDEKLSWDEPPLGGTHACPEIAHGRRQRATANFRKTLFVRKWTGEVL